MSTRSSLQHFVSASEPVGAALGDEWYTPNTALLYKRVAANGVVGWLNITMPDQNGNSGKYLTTNGSTVSWSTVSALPTQTGNSGKYLTTDGVAASWGTVNAGAVLTNTTSASTFYPTFSSSATGNFTTAYVTSTALYYVPSTGTLSATNFNSLSDQRLKTNISTIANATATVSKLTGVEFDWNSTGKKSAGVIAQQLETVLPHLVNESDDGTKSVNYSGIIAYLIETVKELDSRLAQLEK